VIPYSLTLFSDHLVIIFAPDSGADFQKLMFLTTSLKSLLSSFQELSENSSKYILH